MAGAEESHWYVVVAVSVTGVDVRVIVGVVTYQLFVPVGDAGAVASCVTRAASGLVLAEAVAEKEEALPAASFATTQKSYAVFGVRPATVVASVAAPTEPAIVCVEDAEGLYQMSYP